MSVELVATAVLSAISVAAILAVAWVDLLDYSDSEDERLERASTMGDFEWRECTVRTLVVRTPLRTLAVNVSELPGPSFVVAAVEVATDALAVLVSSPVRSVAGMYEDHGHKIIGERSTLDGARAAAEGYAEMWIEHRQRVDACPCSDEEAMP